MYDKYIFTTFSLAFFSVYLWLSEFQKKVKQVMWCFSVTISPSQTTRVDSSWVSFQGSSVPLVTHWGALLSWLKPGIQRGSRRRSRDQSLWPQSQNCIFYFPCVESFPARPSPGRAAFRVCGLWYSQPLHRSYPQSIRGGRPHRFSTARESQSKKLLGQDLLKWDHGEMPLKYSK